MFSSYHCLDCKKDFAKIGAVILTKKGKIENPAKCTFCKSENVITNAEYLELEKKKNKEKKPKLED